MGVLKGYIQVFDRYRRITGSLKSLLVALATGLGLMALLISGLVLRHASQTIVESEALAHRQADVVKLVEMARAAKSDAELEMAGWALGSDAGMELGNGKSTAAAARGLDSGLERLAQAKAALPGLEADAEAAKAALLALRTAQSLAAGDNLATGETAARSKDMLRAQKKFRDILDVLGARVSRENMLVAQEVAREWREEESLSAWHFIVAGIASTGFVGGMTLWLYRRLVGRVDSLKRKAWRLQEGDLASSLLPDERDDELSVVAETLEGMRIGLGSLLEELEDKVSKRTSELESSNEQLATALEDLKQAQGEAVESKKRSALLRMSAVMSHEINTPISSAMLTVTTMRDVAEKMRAMASSGSLNRASLLALIAKMQSGVELAEESLGKASSTIEALKAATASDSSKSQDVIDLAIWASQYCDQKRREWGDSNVEISYLCRYETLPVLTVEPMLRRTIDELMSNVASHGFKGGKGRVLLSIGGGSSGAWIEVSDDGEGIARENMGRVFDAYYTTEMGRHSGLGLFRAKTWTEDILRCSIECQSPCAPNGAESWRSKCTGPGSTFRIEGIALARHSMD
jgi:signal transduction histidine kinase